MSAGVDVESAQCGEAEMMKGLGVETGGSRGDQSEQRAPVLVGALLQELGEVERIAPAATMELVGIDHHAGSIDERGDLIDSERMEFDIVAPGEGGEFGEALRAGVVDVGRGTVRGDHRQRVRATTG